MTDGTRKAGTMAAIIAASLSVLVTYPNGETIRSYSYGAAFSGRNSSNGLRL